MATMFLPVYSFTLYDPTGQSTTTSLTMFDHGYGGWRFILAAVLALSVVIGVINSILKVGDKGAVFVFVVLRVLCLAQLGMIVAAIVIKTPQGIVVPHGFTSSVSLLWPIWPLLAVGVIAMGGALAAQGKVDV
ncbi:MAG: hypothetical protein M1121_05130 [Actinobacteria bacterium]|nr:hypothetical protein [Actinomycetota bacterium]